MAFCSRKPNGLEAELRALRGDDTALWVACDVSKEDQIESLITTVVSRWGKIDCLLNNAGWHPPPKTIDEFSTQDLRDLFQLNFVSYFLACKLALPHLRKTKGNIINMSSWVGAHGQSQATTYQRSMATQSAAVPHSSAKARWMRGAVRVAHIAGVCTWRMKPSCFSPSPCGSAYQPSGRARSMPMCAQMSSTTAAAAARGTARFTTT